MKKRFFSVLSFNGVFLGFFPGSDEVDAIKTMYEHSGAEWPPDDPSDALPRWIVAEVSALPQFLQYYKPEKRPKGLNEFRQLMIEVDETQQAACLLYIIQGLPDSVREAIAPYVPPARLRWR